MPAHRIGSTPPRTTVLLGIQAPLVRAGLRMIVDQADDLEVVADVADADAVRATRADVYVLSHPVLGDAEETVRLVADLRPAAVLALLGEVDAATVVRVLAAGASGVIGMRDPDVNLLAGIRAAAQRLSVLTEQPLQVMLERAVPPAPASSDPATRRAAEGLEDLTQREREVLECVAGGLSNAGVAERLVVSQATVKTHMGNVLSKLGATHRSQVVMLAYECGVVRPGDD